MLSDLPILDAASSSKENIPAAQQALQPFQCTVCRSRFTRHENLKRHLLLHSSSDKNTKHPCFYCAKIFSRRDLRKRHIKKQHPNCDFRENGHINRVEAAIPSPDSTQAQFTVDSHNANASPSSRHHEPSTSSQALEYATGSSSESVPDLPRTPSSIDIEYARPVQQEEQQDTEVDYGHFEARLSEDIYQIQTHDTPQRSSFTHCDLGLPLEIISLGIELYFQHISPYLPFIHQSTVSPTQTPKALLMGILSVGMQFAADKEMGARIASHTFRLGQQLLETVDSSEEPFRALDINAIQAYLLLELHAALYSGSWATSVGMKMHHRSVELARRCGLTEPLATQSGSTGDLEALWIQFIRRESHKRTLFVIHQMDVFWYHTLSLPRLLSHLEIKHELPCPEPMWSAQTSTEWAHLALLNNGRQTSNRYLEVVQDCLSTKPSRDVTGLEPFGALIILLFFLSSAQEVSGWTTMTGRLCFERFDALNASLMSFEPLIERLPDDSPIATLTKATWHMVMIELLNWSLTHTNGVVEVSLDAAFAAATHLSISQDVFPSPEAVSSMAPHINYFLTHLNQERPVYDEAPWVTIFAFKASLVAWQLVRAGVWHPTVIADIHDKDDMFRWIRQKFERRTNWCVGRFVTNSLQELEAVS